jgi:hypothetical protein
MDHERGCSDARTMEKLSFTLPDFTRITWVSDRARGVWEPRLNRIREAWMAIEWLAVADGVRRCCITFASPEDFLVKGLRWAELGLNPLPVEIQGISNYSYQNRPTAYDPAKPFVFRFVLGKPADVVAFKAAYEANDERAIADFLGYPPCCYQFYRRVWVDDGQVDTTWPMAVGTAAAMNGDALLEVGGPLEANILWRWMGIRAVSHLPCRFDCPRTVALGQQLLEVGRRNGFAEEMGWLGEILRWPVEWSALHGIAEIKTPILKVTTNTDATTRKYVVRRPGDAFPAEGAAGLNFPFQVPERLHLTESRGFRHGLENPLPIVEAPPAADAAENGFASCRAMDQAHEPIVRSASQILAGRGGNVLDLGCGNGVLLKKIEYVAGELVPFGVDPVAGRIASARRLWPGFAQNFIVGNMFDEDTIWEGDRRFALALLMPGRFLETTPARGERLKRLLKERCDRILVYAYGDWLTRFQDLTGLARQAGWSLEQVFAEGNVGLATVT